MGVKRMEHVGIVVDDLDAAIAFFTELGLELEGGGRVQGDWVDRVVGLDGVVSDLAMLRTPDGHGCIELSRFQAPSVVEAQRSPELANAAGLRHVLFVVDELDEVIGRLRAGGAELIGTVEQYRDSYRLCYLRGPAGIIVELAEELS